MILLEVENRGVQDALNNHFEAAKTKGKFDTVDAKICDYDGCIYHLTNPSGNREKLQVMSCLSIRSKPTKFQKIRSAY